METGTAGVAKRMFDVYCNLKNANCAFYSSSYHYAEKRKVDDRLEYRSKRRKVSTALQNVHFRTRIQIQCEHDNSTFDLDNIEMIADSIGDNQFLHVSNCAVVVYKGSNIVPDNKCLSNLILNRQDFQAKCNSEGGMLLYKDVSGMLYSVAQKFSQKIRRSTCDFSYSVYFDTAGNKFAEIYLPNTKHRSRAIPKRRLSGKSTTEYCTNHKQSRISVCVPRPISLGSEKKRTFDDNCKEVAIPLPGISYNNDNYHEPVIAQTSDSRTEPGNYLSSVQTGPTTDDLSLILPHLSAQSSDDGAGGNYYLSSFRGGLTTDGFSLTRTNLSGEVQSSLHNIFPPIRRGREYSNTTYMNFIDIEARRNSFTIGWPHSRGVQNIENMVQCGFFFTGNGDLIRCYQCGIGLKDWGHTDQPLTEHVRYSPNCQYISDVIPPTMLRNIKASFLPNNVVSTRESMRADSVAQATNTVAEAGNTNEQIVLPVQPRNPHYVEINVRMSSFSKWPRDITQTPEELAEAGFFYTGCNDIVRCFACDGGLQKWSPGDSAWVEHARWFPHCSYVLVKKGEDFIELVRLSAEQEETEEQEDSEQGAGGYTAAFDEAAIGGMEHLSISDKTEDTHSFDYIKKAACEVLECSEEKVTRVVKDMKLRGLQITQESVVNYVLECILNEPNHQSDSLINFQKEPESVEELIDETEKLRNVIKCHKCGENDVNCLFLPCAHHCFCIACSNDISICPMCQQKIKNKVKTFMS